MESVEKGDQWAVKYVLSRLGKERGYKDKYPEERKSEIREREEERHMERIKGIVYKFPDKSLEKESFEGDGWQIMNDRLGNEYAVVMSKGEQPLNSYNLNRAIYKNRR